MGYLKLNPSDLAQPTRVTPHAGAETRAKAHLPMQQCAGLKPRTKDPLSGAEQHALARIAQRFAPGAQSAVAPEHRRFPSRLPQTPFALAALPGVRMLIAVLIVIALLPNLALAAMFWLGVINPPWSKPTGPKNQAPRPMITSAAVMPVVKPVASKGSAAIRPVALAAPAKFEAHLGRDIPFAIALDRTGALPARSIIAIGGLPQGATLSSGRPYGETGWNLRSDEIGDLRLVLTEAVAGETTLRLRLVAPDGDIIAGTETVLEVIAGAEADAGDPAQLEAQPPADVYDRAGVIGIGAWDNQVEPPLSGIEERFAIAETPTPPPVRSTIPETPTDPPADPVQPPSATDDPQTEWIKPAVFVNLRKGPSSSAAIIGVVPKGTKLSIEGRRRGWVQVTNPATSKSGWIYAGTAVGDTKSSRRAANRGSRPDTLWAGLGQWLAR